jgi:hypothetical protein
MNRRAKPTYGCPSHNVGRQALGSARDNAMISLRFLSPPTECRYHIPHVVA